MRLDWELERKGSYRQLLSHPPVMWGPCCVPGSLSPKEALSCPSCPLLLKVSPSPLLALLWAGILELCFGLNPTGLGVTLGVLSRREEQELILGCKNIPGAENVKDGNADSPQCLRSFNFTMAPKCFSGHHPAHFFSLVALSHSFQSAMRP